MKLIPTQPPVEEMTFEEWARAKYTQINSDINPCDDSGQLDPVRLNQVLTRFAGHFAWAITMQEVESNKLNIANHEHDRWYKGKYNEAFRLIQTETGGGRAPGQVTIDARIVDMCGEEVEARRIALEILKSRVDLLKGFVKVLDKQAGILQTLSGNMRSELFFAGGVTMQEGSGGKAMTDNQKNAQAKLLLRNATQAQGV